MGVNDAYLAVTGVTILATGGIGIAGLANAPMVVKNAVDVGVAPAWVPLLGAVKVAGAIGLFLGLFGLPLVGTAAAAGLVAFFLCAIAFHVRAHVLYNVAFPGFFLALAVASLLLSIRAAA